MSDDGFIHVVDWNKHQHYKKSKPPWIKLYREVLTDYEVTGLEPWERWCLVGLWLLAAETDNEIPADLNWLRARLVIDQDPPISKLQTLGFIEVGDVSRETLEKPLSKTETETETEKKLHMGSGDPAYPPPSKLEKNGRGYVYPEDFEAAWSAYPDRRGGNPKKGAYRQWRARVTDGSDPGALLEAAEGYASYVEAEGIAGEPTVMMAQTFFGPDERWDEDWLEQIPEPKDDLDWVDEVRDG